MYCAGMCLFSFDIIKERDDYELRTNPKSGFSYWYSSKLDWYMYRDCAEQLNLFAGRFIPFFPRKVFYKRMAGAYIIFDSLMYLFSWMQYAKLMYQETSSFAFKNANIQSCNFDTVRVIDRNNKVM